jgi:mannose-6-phosphate isomerase-like protein (cupin superfamily)
VLAPRLRVCSAQRVIYGVGGVAGFADRRIENNDERTRSLLASLIRPLAILGLVMTLGSNSANSHPSFINAWGARMTLELSSTDTNGASSTFRVEAPPGRGPRAHIHTREDETYVVTRGHFRFWIGTQVVDAMPGSVIFLPRNKPHQWLNVGKTTGEVIFTIVPGGLDRFFLEVNKRGLTVPKDRAEVDQLQAVYGIRPAPSFTK